MKRTIYTKLRFLLAVFTFPYWTISQTFLSLQFVQMMMKSFLTEIGYKKDILKNFESTIKLIIKSPSLSYAINGDNKRYTANIWYVVAPPTIHRSRDSSHPICLVLHSHAFERNKQPHLSNDLYSKQYATSAGFRLWRESLIYWFERKNNILPG